MKIFFAGYLEEGQTSRDRMIALKRLGHEIVEFDISAHDASNRLLRSAQSRFHPRFLLGELNRALQVATAGAGRRPDLVGEPGPRAGCGTLDRGPRPGRIHHNAGRGGHGAAE